MMMLMLMALHFCVGTWKDFQLPTSHMFVSGVVWMDKATVLLVVRFIKGINPYSKMLM
jgi:hypothetical protein